MSFPILGAERTTRLVLTCAEEREIDLMNGHRAFLRA